MPPKRAPQEVECGLHSVGARPVREATARLTRELARHRAAEHLHRLGARPVYEALKEVAAGRDLDATLAQYGHLDPDVVRALGGDMFPPAPIRLLVSK